MKIKGILVEGVDCSGKSTLIKKLDNILSRYGWDSIDLRHRKGNQFDRYLYTYTNNPYSLFDRGHFSEHIFGNIWRGASSFSQSELEWLNKLISENFLVVFAHAPEEILIKRYNNRKSDQTIVSSELLTVQNKFFEAFNDIKKNIIYYDSSNWENLETTVSKICKLLNINPKNHSYLKTTNIFEDSSKNILLEGVNGSGKSTLAKLLKINMVGWNIKTLDFTTNPSKFDYYLKEYVNNKNTIFDRGHFSEIAYANIFRKGKHFNAIERALLSDYVRNKFTVIFCNPPIDVLIERIESQRYPKHIHISQLEDVKRHMLDSLDNDKIKYHLINTSNESEIKDLVEMISIQYGTIKYSDMNWAKPNK